MIRRLAVGIGGLLAAASIAPAASFPVEHTVTRVVDQRGGRFDISTMRPVGNVTVTESWIDPERSARRDVTRRDGVVVLDELCAAPACSTDTTVVGNPGAGIREDLRLRRARVVRNGVVRGHRVRWLRYGTARSGRLVAVDRSTSKPLREIDTRGGRMLGTLDFLVDERIAGRASDFAPHTPWPMLEGQSRPEGSSVQPADGARAVPGALWVGRSLGGAKLHAIRDRAWTADTRAGKHLSGTILDIHYGQQFPSRATRRPTANPTRPSIEIIEVADRDPARWFLVYPPDATGAPYPPPAGLADILGYDMFGYQQATLRKPGVWVIVRATTWPLLAKALHSLRPLG